MGQIRNKGRFRGTDGLNGRNGLDARQREIIFPILAGRFARIVKMVDILRRQITLNSPRAREVLVNDV